VTTEQEIARQVAPIFAVAWARRQARLATEQQPDSDQEKAS